MGGGGAMSDMRKRYEQNVALLQRTRTFEVMKDYYQSTYRDDPSTPPDAEALKQWREQRASDRRRKRLVVGLIYTLLVILSAVSLWWLS